jgi:hypothetical protein
MRVRQGLAADGWVTQHGNQDRTLTRIATEDSPLLDVKVPDDMVVRYTELSVYSRHCDSVDHFHYAPLGAVDAQSEQAVYIHEFQQKFASAWTSARSVREAQQVKPVLELYRYHSRSLCSYLHQID